MKKTKVEARSTTTAEASRRTRKVSIGSSNLTEGMGCAVPAGRIGGYDGGACGRHAERGEVQPDQQGRTRGSGTAVPEPRVRPCWSGCTSPRSACRPQAPPSYPPILPAGTAHPIPSVRFDDPMLTFLVRRLASAVVVLLASTFVFFILVSYAVDPLEDLRTSTQINKAQLIEQRIRLLDLDTPPVLRYFHWLRGVLGYLWGDGTLGASWKTNRPTTELLSGAIGVTLRLVVAAALLAMILGVTVGIASALRQYSGFDYTITFMSFLLYSLPTFWVAVLLKQWGAIGFNDFLRDPTIGLWGLIGIAVVAGLIWSALVGGPGRRRLTTLAIAGGVTGLT